MYFLMDWKPAVLRAFLTVSGTPEWETEPNLDLFLRISVPPMDDYVCVTLKLIYTIKKKMSWFRKHTYDESLLNFWNVTGQQVLRGK